nr:hypothetical protein [Streptomyces sp. ME01-18a]
MVARDAGRILVTSSIASTMPGSFQAVHNASKPFLDDPAQVARQGLDALFRGKEKLVAGSLRTRAQGLANKALPDTAKSDAHRKMAEPGSGDRESSDRQARQCRAVRIRRPREPPAHGRWG